MEEGNKPEIPLQQGSYFEGFLIVRRIGRGGYGEIFHVKDLTTQNSYAMKCELVSAKKTGLLNELSVSQKLQKCTYFPKFYSSGEKDNIRYVIMELFGPSISKLFKNCPGKHISGTAFIQTSIEMIKCIRAFHDSGFIHCDIKPSNFLMRGGHNDYLVLIDYGLVKEYIDPFFHGHIKKTEKKSFKGTLKYCSPYVHKGLDQSRRDDMFSWLYSIIEMFLGELLWKDSKDKALIQKSKKSFDENLGIFLPKQFVLIHRLIRNLDYYDCPDYDQYIEIIQSLYETFDCNPSEPFPWELFSEEHMKQISVFPLNKGPNPEPYEKKDCCATNSMAFSDSIMCCQKKEIANGSIICNLI